MAAEIWLPDSHYYVQCERAWLIRSVCLDILAVLEKILKIRNRVPFLPYLYRNDLLNLYSHLEMADGALKTLGVVDEMHPEIQITQAETHPEELAEWLASQLLPWTGPDLDTLVDPVTIELILHTFYVYFDAAPPENS